MIYEKIDAKTFKDLMTGAILPQTVEEELLKIQQQNQSKAQLSEEASGEQTEQEDVNSDSENTEE